MHNGLARRLRDATWGLHAQAERAGVMPALLRGSLPAPQFHRLQRNLLALYAAMEPALDAAVASQPVVAALWGELTLREALRRSQALADDLRALAGPGWPALSLVPSTLVYAQRLTTLGRERPFLLAAHAYVRYLGDLSGGQALGRLARQSYGLSGPDGSRFFDFGPSAVVAAISAQLRQALDSLPVDETQALALADEARWAFEQHVQLFDELAAAPPALSA